MEQLGDFDLKDDVAWNTLKSSRAACGPGTFVLEYFVSEGNDLQFVYVMTKVCSKLPPFVMNVPFKGGKFEFQREEIIDENFIGIHHQGSGSGLTVQL
jgi:hypothetical protein